MFQRTLLPSIVNIIIIVIISLMATTISNNHVQAFHQSSSANNKYTKFAFAPAFVTTGTTTTNTITTHNTSCFLFFSRSRPCRRALSHHSLSSSSSSSGVVLEARDELVRIASSLVSDSPTGLFLTLPSDRSKFMKAVARLEALAAIPDSVGTFESDCIGDWILLATSRKDPLLDPLLSSISGAGSGSAGSGGSDSYDSSSSTSTPLSIRKLDPKLRNSLCVVQRIRATRSDDAPNTVDRIDNVIEFNNAKTKLLPDFLNPLQIDKSKLVLIHKARVESSSPVFRIRLALSSIVLNLAGQSRNLDPMGKDVLGLNVNLPFLNEWMVNSGEFETTYVDQEVRVSRGTIGFLEETRVFVRQNGMFDSANATTTTSDSTNATQGQEQEPSQLGNVVAAVEEVADAVGNLTKSIKATVERDVEYMKEDMETSLEDLKNVVQEDFKGVQKAVDKVKSAVLGDEKLEKAVDDSVEAVSKLGEDVQEAVGEDVEDLKKTVEEDMENVQSAMEGVKDVVTGEEDEDVDDEKAQHAEKDTNQK